ncbi:MAG: hypothetical protein H6735_25020 [Alphaproteobacteria bacterium]|nr:hypothetical protein [Alphaproteobacteria bacterium]
MDDQLVKEVRKDGLDQTEIYRFGGWRQQVQGGVPEQIDQVLPMLRLSQEGATLVALEPDGHAPFTRSVWRHSWCDGPRRIHDEPRSHRRRGGEPGHDHRCILQQRGLFAPAQVAEPAQ